MTVNEGEAFVAGDDSDTAKNLLEAAEKAGLDPSVVRTAPGEGGFIVPAELAPKTKGKSSDDKSEDKPAAKPAAKSEDKPAAKPAAKPTDKK